MSVSARPDDLGAGFDLALGEECDSANFARPLPRVSVRESVPSTDAVVWSLPAHASPGEWCGRVIHFGHTRPSGEKDHRTSRRRCGRASCSVCALAPGGWASREADAIAARVLAGRPKVARLPIHVTVSPAKETWPRFYTRGDYPKVRAEAYRQARAKGLLGAAWIFHPKRMPTDRWATKKDGTRSDTRDRCEDGPHYHAIGYGWMGESHPEGERWSVWNLGTRKSVRGTAFYCLTHAGLSSLPTAGISPMPDLSHPRGPFEAVTWTGILSYRMRITVPEASAPSKCAVCGVEVPQKEWYRLTWAGSGPPPDGSGVCAPGEWRAEELDETAGFGGRVWVMVEV